MFSLQDVVRDSGFFSSFLGWQLHEGAHKPWQESDIQYEEDLLRNNFSVKSWLRYLEHKKSAPPAVRFMIFERSLKELPGR